MSTWKWEPHKLLQPDSAIFGVMSGQRLAEQHEVDSQVTRQERKVLGNQFPWFQDSTNLYTHRQTVIFRYTFFVNYSGLCDISIKRKN